MRQSESKVSSMRLTELQVHHCPGSEAVKDGTDSLLMMYCKIPTYPRAMAGNSKSISRIVYSQYSAC